jgi:hypothetical protein
MPKGVVTLTARTKRKMTDEQKVARQETIRANKVARAERVAEYEARTLGALKDPEIFLPDDVALATDKDLMGAIAQTVSVVNRLKAQSHPNAEALQEAEAELNSMRVETKRRRAEKELAKKELARINSEAAFDARKDLAISDPDNYRIYLNKTSKDLKWWEEEGKLRAEVLRRQCLLVQSPK